MNEKEFHAYFASEKEAHKAIYDLITYACYTHAGKFVHMTQDYKVFQPKGSKVFWNIKPFAPMNESNWLYANGFFDGWQMAKYGITIRGKL